MTKELNKHITQLEELLKKMEQAHDQEDIKQLYSEIRKFQESSALLGINTLSKALSALESNIMPYHEKNSLLPNDVLAKCAAMAHLAPDLIKDTELKDSTLSTTYHNFMDELDKTKKSESSKKAQEDNIMYSNKFQEVFFEEATDLINQLEEKLLQLESEPNDKGLIDNVFRIMHTLKGNSNMFGYANLGEITHHLENIYDAIRGDKLSTSRAILNITLNCIDHFRNLLEDPELMQEDNKVMQDDILDEMKSLLNEDQAGEQQESEEHDIASDSHQQKTFYLYFKPQPNVFDDGTNPMFFVYDLYELGECLPIPFIEPPAKGKKFSPLVNYTGWHIALSTNESKEGVLENFMFLRDDSQPDVQVISLGNVIADAKFSEWFRSKAEKPEQIKDFGEFAHEKAEKKERSQRNVQNKTTQDGAISSIRVAASKIDMMMNLISELVTKQAELSIIAGENNNTRLQEVAESIESISRDLRDNAFSISLIPLEKSVLRFQRLVRDVSSKFDKKVDFIVEGKETELDKTIIEKIVDPIMHILRNSIDHGIESPAERVKQNKPETGTIRLKAFPSGAHVVIQITDDGAGINIEKVRKTAVRKGYVKEGDLMSKEEMLKLILSPGFSTADNISEVSGRGVGMDVVFQKISEIRGELDIETNEGKGTTITIKLPLTISIIDSLLVKLGNIFYLVPLAVVERCAEVPTKEITEATSNYINLDGEYIPFIDLHSEFNIQTERENYQRLILVKQKELLVGLVVDNIMGNHQAVLKSLGAAYKKQEIISGASILGNGEVALVMDTNKLLQLFMAETRMNLDQMEQDIATAG